MGDQNRRPIKIQKHRKPLYLANTFNNLQQPYFTPQTTNSVFQPLPNSLSIPVYRPITVNPILTYNHPQQNFNTTIPYNTTNTFQQSVVPIQSHQILANFNNYSNYNRNPLILRPKYKSSHYRPRSFKTKSRQVRVVNMPMRRNF